MTSKEECGEKNRKGKKVNHVLLHTMHSTSLLLSLSLSLSLSSHISSVGLLLLAKVRGKNRIFETVGGKKKEEKSRS